MANAIRIYKSSNAEKLDDHFKGDGERLRALYTAALQQYEQLDGESLSTMVTNLASLDVPWDAEAANHFATEWPNAGPGRTNADPILRHGYQEAFQLALSHEPPVPLETFWVTGAGNDFEVHVSDGDDHVTVFMIVTGTPGDDIPAGSKKARNKSWVVTSGGRANDDGRGQPQPLAEGNVVKVEVSGLGRTPQS
jgi:hypothetical protein